MAEPKDEDTPFTLTTLPFVCYPLLLASRITMIIMSKYQTQGRDPSHLVCFSGIQLSQPFFLPNSTSTTLITLLLYLFPSVCLSPHPISSPVFVDYPLHPLLHTHWVYVEQHDNRYRMQIIPSSHVCKYVVFSLCSSCRC